MGRLGMDEGEPIEHRLVSNAIEKAQKRVEGHNFDIRKHLLEYDDVMNKQREVIYAQRRQILAGKTLEEDVMDMAGELVDEIVAEYTADKLPEEWDNKSFSDAFYKQFGFRVSLENMDGDLRDVLLDLVQRRFAAKREEIGPELFQQLQQMVMLQIVDNHWKEHLLSMDHLRDGIGLRGYAQRDPLREYQREGYDMFMDLIHRIEADSVGTLFHLQVQPHHEPPPEARPKAAPLAFSHGDSAAQPKQRQNKKVGRNDPCPCGSGKKYKKCCGK
jgi:preprotein translocase subunit SecA